MKNSLGLLCLSFLLITDGALLANTPSVRIKRSQVLCEPIGRIIEKRNRQFQDKTLICAGQKIEIVKGKKVKFLCFSSGDIIWLSSGVTPSNKCAITNTSATSCNPNNVNVCLIRKGGSREEAEPTIVYPYTSSLMNPRPKIAWLPVSGATAYKVKVSGYDFAWEKVVSGNEIHITYPAQEKELPFGQAFQITVIAYRKDAQPTADTFTINLFAQLEIQQVLDTVAQINSLELPKDEAALDIDAVYMSRGFLDESIELLSQVAINGNTNPTLHRVLGDRYFEAGLTDKATVQYMKASELAKRSNDGFELQKVKEGLEAIEFYSQLPTRIKGDQK
ncbi:tetratricopeptide repeat protein [Nostoc sp. MS1]|uniref:tetratricopeptide repeat protein n=1 Tax=Nostoc sp. MS1 TaxID=2764711 RepID=UPI001CC493A2|nr:hypothetical protein [Nostoc sp. MS1]BCL39629.1 hypothetical protein NSMS1_60760 [Nostoc sp. MS1]